MDDTTLPPHPPTTVAGEPVPVPRAVTTDDPHVVPSAHLANLRDVGGRRTTDGRTVRRGVVFRSAELRAPAIADDPAIVALGVRTVVDLRTSAERSAVPDVLPAGARGVHADVIDVSGHEQAPAADLTQILRHPREAQEVLRALDAPARMRATYVDLVTGDAGRTGYAALLRQLLQPGAAPLLYHCTAGKDRTGWATTVLLLVAGVDLDQVREEYLAVNPAVRAMYAPLLDGFSALGGDADLLVPLLEVREEYLDAALDALTAAHGSVEAYVRDGLGLTDDEVAALRDLLVD